MNNQMSTITTGLNEDNCYIFIPTPLGSVYDQLLKKLKIILYIKLSSALTVLNLKTRETIIFSSIYKKKSQKIKS